MPPRPHNHVTEAQEEARTAALRSSTEAWPEVPLELVEFLERVFPARCYDHRGETLEDHLGYAGKVDLVGSLREAFEEQRRAAIAMDPADGSGLSVEVDRHTTED